MAEKETREEDVSATEYWNECVAAALEEHGLPATPDQITAIASDIEGAHENYGMAFPGNMGPHPLQAEVDDLRRQLQRYRDASMCKRCGGSGRIQEAGPYHGIDTDCWECRGQGWTA